MAISISSPSPNHLGRRDHPRPARGKGPFRMDDDKQDVLVVLLVEHVEHARLLRQRELVLHILRRIVVKRFVQPKHG
jgi:hypothetical protein